MSGKHWSIIPGTVSYVQRYCGLEKRQVTLALSVGGLDGSLPQIFSYLKNLGIPDGFDSERQGNQRGEQEHPFHHRDG